MVAGVWEGSVLQSIQRCGACTRGLAGLGATGKKFPGKTHRHFDIEYTCKLYFVFPSRLAGRVHEKEFEFVHLQSLHRGQEKQYSGAQGNMAGIRGYRSGSWIHREPGVWAHHGKFVDVAKDAARLRMPYFLMTMVREPAERCMSAFYHIAVSMKHKSGNTLEGKLSYLKGPECRDYQFNYMRRDLNEASVKDVLGLYDFVGVQEHFDDSVVTLARLLKVDLGDVLYIKSKVSQDPNRKELPHPPLEQEPQEVQNYIRNEFREENARDYALYDAAVARLVEQARPFKQDVRQFQELLANATRKCEPAIRKSEDRRRTSINGVRNEFRGCYWHDNGCFYSCLDDFVKTRSLP